MEARYQILDEPSPGALSAIAVNPVWPLLAAMLGGIWLAVPWFIANAFALGSPTRVRETLLALGTVAGSFALVVALFVGANAAGLSRTSVRYLVLLPILWKLGACYGLYLLQRRTFGLFEYYGGKARNPLLVLIAAAVLRQSMVGSVKSVVLLLALA